MVVKMWALPASDQDTNAPEALRSWVQEKRIEVIQVSKGVAVQVGDDPGHS